MADQYQELLETEKRFVGLEAKLADPDVINGDAKYPEYLREHGKLAPLVEIFRRYNKTRTEAGEAEEMAKDDSDPEMAELAKSELKELKKKLETDTEALKKALITGTGDGDKNALIELRAGTGGDESALFVADLVRMYTGYADRKGWRLETLEAMPSERGGFKEITLSLSGDDVYAFMNYESGTHRVQRVPETESQGRVHTSAATVAVLAEAEEIDVEIRPEDIRKDTFCSSGPGGQSVNTTYSAVRLTHIPTGVVVSCQDEKSQIKNAEKAMRVLRSRLYEAQKLQADAERSANRKQQVGTGDRSQKIRTYNYPQNRVTDHRIGLTLYDLQNIVRGALEDVHSALIEEESRRRFSGLF